MHGTDELKRIVELLATGAGRAVATPGHEAARTALLAEMRGAGLEGYAGGGFEHGYKVDGQAFCNLLGTLPGSRPELEPVLLAAHYDTCGPYPGADDNAAAVAILLALVEPLRQASLERPVIFAFFDAEEPPHFLTNAMGSSWFYAHQRTQEVHCALVLDLVGHDVAIPGFEDLLFVTGMESDPGLEAVVRSGARAARSIRTLATLTRYVGDMSDYSAFRSDRRPYLFFSCGQWEHYHMPTDTPEKLNYDKMAAIAAYLAGVTVDVAATALEGPFEGGDTTATEIEMFERTAGPLLAHLGIQLRTRGDIDALAGQLMRSFGLLH